MAQDTTSKNAKIYLCSFWTFKFAFYCLFTLFPSKAAYKKRDILSAGSIRYICAERHHTLRAWNSLLNMLWKLIRRTVDFQATRPSRDFNSSLDLTMTFNLTTAVMTKTTEKLHPSPSLITWVKRVICGSCLSYKWMQMFSGEVLGGFISPL